jgi:DNA repair photolyase
MVIELTRKHFRDWGSIGGKTSHRILTTDEASNMALHSAASKRRKSRQPAKPCLQENPPHGTQEWAVHNVNIQLGCQHDCKYCYAKCMAIRFKRSTSPDWKHDRILRNKVDRAYLKKNGRIMFPTTHDITPGNIMDCVKVLKKLLAADNDVLIVSKPNLACVQTMCEELSQYRKQILYRFTIGSVNNSILEYWEPNAPIFSERLASLKHAFHSHFSTSVSVEPILDDDVDSLIGCLRSYVTDAIWLGRVNQVGAAIAINCPNDAEARKRAKDLLMLHNDDWIRNLYCRHQKDRKVKWKDSIKKIVGIERPAERGLDI